MPPALVKVAFLQATLGFGGAERLIQTLVNRMDPSRIRASVITLKRPGPIGEQLESAGCQVVSGLARGAWDVRGIGRLARTIAEQDPDVIYVTDSALPLCWAGFIRRRRRKPRIVLGFHSTLKPGDHLKYAVAYACSIPVMDRFVALAPSHRKFLSARFGIRLERFAVIGNSVDASQFRPAEDRVAACREVGLDPGARYVGLVAGLVIQKNHPMFLRAALRLRHRFPQARFLVIGNGPERVRLEKLARQLDLQDVALFLGERDDVAALQRVLDVAVLCTWPDLEAFPMALLEAMASGTPVVSTNVGSIADFIRDGATGYLVASGDEIRFAEAIGTLLADANLRESLGRVGRQSVERDHAVTTMIRAYEDLFVEARA